jgi:hypothetical protein
MKTDFTSPKLSFKKIKMPTFGNVPDFWGFHEPRVDVEMKEYQINFENASDFASKIRFEKNFRLYSFLRCNFQYIDALFHFFCEHRIKANRLLITTLGLNVEAWGSIVELLEVGAVKQFDLVVSSYFYHHNREIVQVIKDEFARLQDEGKCNAQLSVCSNHSKVIAFSTECGKKFVFHGSANAASSDNIEQVMIEENEQLFDFNCCFFDKIINYFCTNKSALELRGKTAWAVATKSE